MASYISIGGFNMIEYKQLKDVNLASHVNDRVFVKFMARDVDVRVQKDGVTKYLTLNMFDRGVCVDAKRFGATDSEIELMRNGSIYQGAIDIKEYAKSPTGFSCVIYNFELCANETTMNYVEWADGYEKAYSTIQSTLNELNEGVYGQLALNIITNIWDKFSVWTGAKSNHHTALGGLVVHTAEVIEQSKVIGDMWEDKYGPNFINRQLLLASALLHDIGKTEELEVDKSTGVTVYGVNGSLETHITMGISMIDIAAYRIGFGYKEIDDEEKTDEQVMYEVEALKLLKHCILSHHGQKEWGSPITPNCPEAYIVHIADRVSADMYRFSKQFQKMEPGTAVTEWISGLAVTTYKDSNK